MSAWAVLALVLFVVGAVPAPAFADDRAAVAKLRARELADQNRCDEALVVLNEASRVASDDATLWLLRGQCELRLQRWTEGATSLERARELDPDLSAASLYLGIARYHEGDLDVARASLDRAREQGATGAQLDLYTGLVLLQKAEHREAALALERARTANGPLVEPVASYYAGLAWRRTEERERALESLERVRDEYPGTVWSEEAIQELERARSPIGRAWAQVTVGMEYDSNVVQLGENQALPQGISDDDDFRGVWELQGGVELFRKDDWSGGVLASYDGNAHIDLDEFDTHFPAIGLWVDREIDRDTLARVFFETGYAWIDYEPFLFEQSVDTAVYHDFGAPGETGIGLNFYWDNYLFSSRKFFPESGDGGGFGPGSPDFGSPIDRLDRDALGLSPYLEHRVPIDFADTWFRGNYTYAHQWGNGRDWDFDAHQFQLGLETTLPFEVRLDTAGTYIYAPFEHPSFFDPGTGDREDNIWIYEAVLSRAITGNLVVSAEYTYVDHSSNVNAYDYDRHIVGLFLTVRLP